jgi:hypothetical protein
MLGGAYLCFEGADKVFHMLFPHNVAEVDADLDPRNPAKLEEDRIAGAIKTDFILSAEIMTIALAEIPSSTLWMEAATLAIVGIGITVLVYGSVALIVKLDDIGLFLARAARLGITRAFGRGLVKFMPMLMAVLSTVGTAAMLWVGGSILTHGLDVLGWSWIADQIHHWAEVVAHAAPMAPGFVDWAASAALNGVIGVAIGLVLIPVVVKVIGPLLALFGKKAAH